MKSMHREWTDRLSAYLAGELHDPERIALEAHLAGCDGCRRVLSDLRRVVALAEQAKGIEPPRDLWPGIEGALAGARASTERTPSEDVIALPTAQRRQPITGWRLSPGALAAAAVLLVVLTAGTTWRIAQRPSSLGGDGLGVTAPGAEATRMAAASLPPPSVADQVAALQEVLDSARETLDPNTVRVLERNLTAIERAIADSKEALAADPGNAFLSEHLERLYQRKLTYLQDVVRVVEWAG